MKRFLCFLLLFVHSVAFASIKDYIDNPVSTVEYGGISFQCTEGCGTLYQDPVAQDIAAEFRSFIRTRPKKRWGLYTVPEYQHEYGLWKEFRIYPHVGGGTELDDSMNFERYNWEGTNGEYNPYSGYRKVHLNFSRSDFLSIFNLMRSDLFFYYSQECKYRDDRKKLREYNLEAIRVAESHEYSSVDYDDITGKITHFSSWSDKRLDEAREKEESRQRSIDRMTPDEDYADALDQVNQLETKIDSLFREIFTYCLQHHQQEGIAFNDTLEALLYGEYEDGMARLEELIAIAEKQKFDDALIGKMLFLKGELQAEFCEHADAIISLTQALQKNPAQKDVYLERASSYFELGQFDKAIEDYLMQRDVRHFAWPQDDVDFALGLIEGAATGLVKACVEFVPHTISSLHGIGQMVWTGLEDPIGSSRRIIEASINLCNTLRECSFQELATLVTPECADLIRSWNTLSPRERGERFGKIVGEGSLMVFTPLAWKHAKKFMPLVKELKRGEKAAALESLSNPSTRQGMTQAAKQWAENRSAQVSKITIEMNKQNKHIPTSEFFDPNKSPFTHPNPQKLLDGFSGKGRKSRPDIHGIGTPGYKEKVDFGELIGEVMVKGMPVKTTWGMIHYSKKGAHIVPVLPDKM